MNPEIDPVTIALLAVLAIFFGTVLLVKLAEKINDLSRRLDNINMEIARTEGREKKLWKRKKRRLWLSLLPFFRR